jgi:hypothetical protein
MTKEREKWRDISKSEADKIPEGTWRILQQTARQIPFVSEEFGVTREEEVIDAGMVENLIREIKAANIGEFPVAGTSINGDTASPIDPEEVKGKDIEFRTSAGERITKKNKLALGNIVANESTIKDLQKARDYIEEAILKLQETNKGLEKHISKGCIKWAKNEIINVEYNKKYTEV